MITPTTVPRLAAVAQAASGLIMVVPSVYHGGTVILAQLLRVTCRMWQLQQSLTACMSQNL